MNIKDKDEELINVTEGINKTNQLIKLLQSLQDKNNIYYEIKLHAIKVHLKLENRLKRLE